MPAYKPPLPPYSSGAPTSFSLLCFWGGHLCPLLSPCPLNAPPCHFVQRGLIHRHRVLTTAGSRWFSTPKEHMSLNDSLLAKTDGSDRAPVAHGTAHKLSVLTGKAFASALFSTRPHHPFMHEATFVFTKYFLGFGAYNTHKDHLSFRIQASGFDLSLYILVLTHCGCINVLSLLKHPHLSFPPITILWLHYMPPRMR